MPPTTATVIPKFQFREPVRNFPHHPGGRCKEDLMTLRFGQAYLAQLQTVHGRSEKNSIAVARQIPVNGYGIADFVAVCWNQNRVSMAARLDVEQFAVEGKPTVRAFEMKLADWRKALMQASRYRFFAHVAIVVLPEENCMAPLKHLDTFQTVGVGLWSFDRGSNRITTYFTPRPSSPPDKRHHSRVLQLVAQASKALPIA